MIRIEHAAPELSGGFRKRLRVSGPEPSGPVAPVPGERAGYRPLRDLLVALDVAGALVVWAAVIAAAGRGQWPARVGRALPLALAIAVLTVLVNAAQRLYLARVCSVRSHELARLARTSVVCGLIAAWLLPLRQAGFSIGDAAWGAVGSTVLLALLRGVYSAWLRACRARGRFLRKVCIYGANDEGTGLVELLETQPELGYEVVGVIPCNGQRPHSEQSVVQLDAGCSAADAVRATGASGVIVAVSALPASDLDRLVRELTAAQIHVQVSSGLARVGRQRLCLAPLSYHTMFYVESPRRSRSQMVAKRAMDLVFSCVGLVLSSPVLAFAAIAIKLDDRGPVFYRQERVGRAGRHFEVLKLRTMVPNASAQLDRLVSRNQRTGPLFKLADDPRVTRVGRFLRASSIDELPQLLNVFRGDMSIVGPRPALPAEVEQFDPELRERVSVPPGITGLWQVEARDNPSFQAYRRLDLFYVDNWSLMLDLAIVISTMRVVTRRGIRAARGSAEFVPTRVAPLEPVELSPVRADG